MLSWQATRSEHDKDRILHPGEMGVSIAASAVNNGHEVCWVSEIAVTRPAAARKSMDS
ncbi:MAG: hypothetical protein U0V48_00690 [Anaerolineales bacterium]